MYHAKPFLYLNSSDGKKRKQKICEVQSLKFTYKDSTKNKAVFELELRSQIRLVLRVPHLVQAYLHCKFLTPGIEGF